MSSYPIGLTEFFETKNPNTLSPKDPPGTNPKALALAYVSMEGVLCLEFLVNFCLLRRYTCLVAIRYVALTQTHAVFPPRYLNYSPHRISCQILKVNFSTGTQEKRTFLNKLQRIIINPDVF